MEIKTIKNKPAIKYFEKYINKYQDINNNNKSNQKEKIQLIFKLINGKTNYSYSLILQNPDNNFNNDSVNSDFMTCSNSNTINLLKCNYDYNFGKEQKLKFELIKKGLNQINSYPFFTTIGDIVGSANNTKRFYINNYNKDEILEVKSLIIKTKEEYVTIHFNIKISSTLSEMETPKSQKEQYFIKEENKIYFKIVKNKKILYESEVFTDDGKFNIVQIPLKILNSNFSVIFFNYKNEYISKIETSVSQITNPKKRKEIFFSNKILNIYSISSIREKISFLDYLKNGVRVALDIGIDFTGSNGHPDDEISYHCRLENQEQRNPYERAILSCANIMAKYDYDQLFPVYGFGAIINGEDRASMCFNINFKEDPNIQYVDNIIKEYYECLNRIEFSYPTYFAPLINKIINEIKKEEDILEYHVLMILTDGIIDDYQDTVDALVEGSFLPLSVIIIGIGNANFKEMVDLDGDNKPLISRSGKKRQRDLVQFVPFNKFEGDEKKLTEEVLDEIPRQIMEFYTLNFYYPESISKNNNNNNQKEPQNQKNNKIENKSIDQSKNNNFNLLKDNYQNNNSNSNRNINNDSNILFNNIRNINNHSNNNFNNSRNLNNNPNNNYNNFNNNYNNNLNNNYNNNFNNNFNNNKNNNKNNNINKSNKIKNYNNNKNYYTYNNNNYDNNFNTNNNVNLNTSNLQYNSNNNQNLHLNNNIQNSINNNRNIYRIPNSSFNNNSNIGENNYYINTPNK